MTIHNRMMSVIVALCLVTLVSSPAVFADTQVSSLESIGYADWSAMSPDARREIFSKLSPTKRASLVRAHVQSWRDRHRAELNANQLEFIDDLLKSITPVKYDGSISIATKKASEKNITDRAQLLFYPEQLTELLGMRLPGDDRFD